MKTYIFDSINRYKRYSENLDIKATLCNKSWWLFNDEGTKSLYIFQENGDLYITTNGVGLKESWQYIPANKSVIINSENIFLMFKPTFIDDNILTLTLDGTNNCAFLIEEQNKAHFSPRSLSDLTSYFEEKENKENEEQERLKRERDAIEKENKKTQEAKRISDQIWQSVERDNKKIKMVYFPLFFLPLLLFLISEDFLWMTFVGLFLWLLGLILLIKCMTSSYDKRIKNWKKEHPHDPRSQYL